jgi:LmbE family N-acetylglucosaminyl deacetylase
MARLQVVVAHPDDETFGCGSVLLHAAAAGATTGVVCATRGEAGDGSGAGPPLGAVREKELREAATVLGVGQIDLLEFGDSGMSGPAGLDTLVGAPFGRVLAHVTAAVAAFGRTCWSPSTPGTVTATTSASATPRSRPPPSSGSPGCTCPACRVR